jgi:uncharacterized protein (TIGR03083 family)
MSQTAVLEAFAQEASELTAALTGLDEADWDRPTGCPPWRVRELLAHIRVAIGRLPQMLADPAPPRAEVSALEYYRPDARFDADTNARRIALGQDHAADFARGADLLADFTTGWQQADRLCREQPEGRVVRTRHGDAMLLADFLGTRVVEVAVHGLDLALALEREPWTTAPAAELIGSLLLGPSASKDLESLGWNRIHFIMVATGRHPISDTEASEVDRLGLHWLTLG